MNGSEIYKKIVFQGFRPQGRIPQAADRQS